MKYLCIDWGLKRVGLAISEVELASPLQTIEISGLENGVGKVLQIINKERAEVVLMGRPEGEMGKNVTRAAAEFKKKGIDVRLVDETLSTQKAKGFMLEIGVSQKARRDDNAAAAAIILQNYLDEQGSFVDEKQ